MVFFFFCFILCSLIRKGSFPSYCLCVYILGTIVGHISKVCILFNCMQFINREEICISLYTYVYKLLFSKIATKMPRENCFIPQLHPQPLKTCKYFSSLHQNPEEKKSKPRNMRMKRNMGILSLGLRV